MVTTILLTIGRTVFAYGILLFLVRLMGRKDISQMTFFNFAVAITLGSVTGNLALGTNNTVYSATIVLITLTLLVLLTGYIHIKSFRGRKLINSEPLTLIKNGKIVYENMQKERIGLDDLTSLLRKKGVFNFADVEFALLENDGNISVLKKSQKLPLTPADLNVSTSYIGLTKDLVIDGNILAENLQEINLDKNWLLEQLNNQGIKEIGEVFYAGLDTSGNLYVSNKIKGKEREGQYGIE